MGHYFKWLGSPEQARELWENREALDKYLAALKKLMEPDKEVSSLPPERERIGGVKVDVKVDAPS